MELKLAKFGKIFLELFLVILFVVIYSNIANTLGFGIKSRSSQFLTEMPVVVLIYYFLRSIQKRNILSYVAAIIPIAILYVSFDYNYMVLGRVLTLTDVLMLDELFDVLDVWQNILIVLFISFPFILIILNLKKPYHYGNAATLSLFVFAFLFISYFPTKAYSYTQKYFPIVSWSQSVTVERNGRLSSMLLFQIQELNAKQLAMKFDASPEREVDYLINSITKKNMHVIVLESFMDVTRFKSLDFKRSPYFETFEKNIMPNINTSISPGVGGGTAEAEFEVLCGVPALGLFGSIEFNVFKGYKTSCLPNTLSKIGYHTMASHPFKPDYYNRYNAYPGLGFIDIRFGKGYTNNENGYLLDDMPEGKNWLYDGSLFRQNLDFVKLHISEGKKPLFNYVLTSYGHLYYQRDKIKRPDLFSVTDNFLNDIINQHYYRSLEIVRYIDELEKIDPTSLIVLIGDHLPPMLEGSYKEYGISSDHGLNYHERLRENIFLIKDGGKFLKFDLVNHYDVYKIILNNLTNGQFCKINTCNYGESRSVVDKYKDEYYSIMSLAMKK